MPLAFNRPTKKHNSYIHEARAAIQMFLEAGSHSDWCPEPRSAFHKCTEAERYEDCLYTRVPGWFELAQFETVAV